MADFIAEFDHIVGELMRELETHGLADNTLVILSDNGPEVASVVHMRADHADGAETLARHQTRCLEGGHRVPFIVRWPGKVKEGTTSDQTLCLTTSSPPSPRSPATNCHTMPAKTASNSSRPRRHCHRPPPLLLTQAFGGQRTLSIRRGQWKYIAHRGSGGTTTKANSSPLHCPRLIKLPHNSTTSPPSPARTTYLYSQKPQIVKELQALLEQTKSTGRSRP